jgi:hypothetical protein
VKKNWINRWLIIIVFLLVASAANAQSGSYYGFDQNIYPGDAALPLLHKHLAYAGYWLNIPPGARINSWKGKRPILVQNGFGFLILYNGRTEAGLKRSNATALAKADGVAAAAAAAREGFPAHAILFLDIEEGGRMVPSEAAYFLAWIKAVRAFGYLPGVYCSGIEVEDDPGKRISTADDIRSRDKEVALWIADDVCPPSPGCVIPKGGINVENSGWPDALVWQYAQSPRRAEFTHSCAATYAPDHNCYAPGTPQGEKSLLDLNVSTSADPSGGR